MKRHKVMLLILMNFACPRILFAEDRVAENSIHKFWFCAIASYNALIEGNYQAGKCRSNTQYSEPPCREFFIEYEGVEGIRPGVPFRQTIERKLPISSSANSAETTQSTTTTIEINKDKEQFAYVHTIEETVGKFTNKWVYNGKCRYYEAPANEKIYIPKGLEAVR
jgi:hypothetical protein